jgi:hypothetical protein
MPERKRDTEIKYKQKVYQDDYGNWQFGDWYRELDYFIEQNISPRLLLKGLRNLNPDTYYAQVTNILSPMVIEEIQKSSISGIEYASVKSGEDYEKYIGSLLQSAGWEVPSQSNPALSCSENIRA